MTSPITINAPALWAPHFPVLSAADHKYSRGHTLVSGGGSTMTGAARLAAISALRAGSGLVTVAVPTEALPIYAASLLAVMVHPVDHGEDYTKMLGDLRITALLVGNGNGLTERTRQFTLHALASGRPCVLDADALTVFQHDPQTLFDAIDSPVVMTPHEGEFKRLFALEGERTSRTQQAAQISHAVMVLKGAETIIAAPDGRTVINPNAPPWLATAGTGDVLAGIIAGLVAQNIEPFYAACIGVWLHGEAASSLGRGMIADDLPQAISAVLKDYDAHNFLAIPAT